jgi:hypothetical protein
MRILKKATPKEIIGVMPPILEETWLYNISGTATGFEVIQSQDKGPSVRLMGEFAVAIISTGEYCISPECFLPAGMGELIRDRMVPKGTDPEDYDDCPKTPASFDLQVGIRPATRKDPVKPYEFVVRTFNDEETVKENPLMRRLMGAPAIKALPPSK